MPIKRLVSILLASLCLSFYAWSGPDADSAAITQGQADDILTELKQIRRLLQRMEQQRGAPVPPPLQQASPQPMVPSPRHQEPTERKGRPVTARVSIKDRPVLGEADAPVTMVEFVDYECPFCRLFFQNTYAELKRQYIDPGKLRLVLKDLPLKVHQHARKAAQAAHCAGEQGRYWPMHDKLFGGMAGLNQGALIAYSEQLGLAGAAFRECLDSDRHLARIEADIVESRTAGIPGTPAFVLGRSAGDEVEGAHIRGALPFRVFKEHIEHLLEEPEVK